MHSQAVSSQSITLKRETTRQTYRRPTWGHGFFLITKAFSTIDHQEGKQNLRTGVVKSHVLNRNHLLNDIVTKFELLLK